MTNNPNCPHPALATPSWTLVLAAALFLAGFNRSLLTSFNPALARARGIDTVASDYLFVVLLTLIVVASLKVVGALLVLVLIVIPAAAAQNIARSLQGFFWFSVLFATPGALSGLLLSAAWPPCPPGVPSLRPRVRCSTSR